MAFIVCDTSIISVIWWWASQSHLLLLYIRLIACMSIHVLDSWAFHFVFVEHWIDLFVCSFVFFFVDELYHECHAKNENDICMQIVQMIFKTRQAIINAPMCLCLYCAKPYKSYTNIDRSTLDGHSYMCEFGFDCAQSHGNNCLHRYFRSYD